MNEKMKALKAAFPLTIPIFAGYILLGSAYGILMSSKGYGLIWIVLMSLIVFAGSMQFVAITLLTSTFNPLAAFFITLTVNIRHLFYGISMLEKYKDSSPYKPYLIFGLTDETFSIICSTEPPQGINRNYFMFFITLLDHTYWVLGSALGGLIGAMIGFNTKGLDFVLTALFVVIFIGQWKEQPEHKPAIIGVACSLLCLVIFGASSFIIPAMLSILVVLTIFRNKLEETK